MKAPVIFNNKWVQIASASIASAVVGSVVGYFVGKRHANVFVIPPESIKEAYEMSDSPLFSGDSSKRVFLDEIQSLKSKSDAEFELLMDKASENPELQAALKERFVRRAEGREEDDEGDEEDDDEGDEEDHSRLLPVIDVDAEDFEDNEKPVNVYAVSDGWNHDEELSTRTREEPYILHRDEFFADEMDFHQETLTYYKGDDIMVDATDTPIYNYAGLMGELKFGHGSGSATTVYIRNEVLRREWEVLLDEGLFAVEVLGLEADNQVEDELRHSNSVLKFRRD